jgi:hypothetical protein
VLVDGQNRGLESENARVSGTPPNEGCPEIID